MGFFETKEKADNRIQNYIKTLLLPGENLIEWKRGAYEDDFYALTDKRLLLHDRDFDDKKQSEFSIAISKITALSLNKPYSSLQRHTFKVGVHVGGLTVYVTYFKLEEATQVYMRLNELIHG